MICSLLNVICDEFSILDIESIPNSLYFIGFFDVISS